MHNSSSCYAAVNACFLRAAFQVIAGGISFFALKIFANFFLTDKLSLKRSMKVFLPRRTAVSRTSRLRCAVR